MEAHMHNAVNAEINLFIAHISFLKWILCFENHVQPETG